jgi:hypothetical protein
MIYRRNIALFSLSFLDCICCGFGAIILLFVLTMGSQTESIRNVKESLQRIMLARLATQAETRTQKEELLRQASARAAIEAEIKKKDTLKSLLDDLEQQIQYQDAGKRALLVDVDAAKRSLAAVQKEPEMILPEVDPAPVGLPVGSNHIAFVIDTSGSMRDPNTGLFWPAILEKFTDVLEAYPQIKGIQLLDADGRFVFGGRGASAQWLPDSPEVRNALRLALARYDNFSNSNPVPGIYQAITRLHSPDDPEMKMAIYILGDEFTGTADAVVRRLDQLNPADENGDRKIVINAIGFPTAVRYHLSPGNTGLKYANLMREVTYQHGGAFIALRDL